MADEIEKKILEAPELPSTVQGDGRYLMSILRNYLEQANLQINLANGYDEDDLKKDDTNSLIPKDFIVEFDRTGTVFRWKHLSDVSNLAYYELRTDTNVGNSFNLLERTLDNYSYKAPITFSATVYLYAVFRDMTYGSAATLSFTKFRPDTPTDIALTKNNEGTLITFLEIPEDCIGANIYVDDVKYTTNTNVFLYPKDDGENIKKVEIAYYDSFGEGERGVLYCVLPDVTGFLVERNGANLDFYWDSMNIYNVQYSIRVNQFPVWESGMEIFRTKLNKKSYIYPNIGGHYFLIKAIDEHNNTSENAVWYYTDHDIEIDKNVILNFVQRDVAYSGNKINCYYDVIAQGLRLEQNALNGEYLMSVALPQEYLARNWLNMDVQGVSSNDTTWNDMEFTWDSELAMACAWAGKVSELTAVSVTKQIALATTVTDSLATINLEDTLAAETGETPFESVGCDDFESGRWADGLKIKDTTRLAYNIDGTNKFNTVFWLKKTSDLPDTVFMTMADSSNNGLYEIGYKEIEKKFYFRGVDDKEIELDANLQERDWIMLGISQGTDKRSLFVKTMGFNITDSMTIDALPQGTLGKLYCYPKILI